ncbi:hypothetical protein CPAR01_08601 [Colletotrichum paranaense]|uniref:Uncharacterized protein n=1 Tax=Colletotrichum paranaense TaxID=1914294 RepID=A0ABQ9SKQ9_9PEZI|nr:uncharacterized protein CPAR01_08601 [Colletotrichum paranaense]KAK1538488.1 hypothetical protein CPAR01_08601 [Colletotrichum paranaense]
MQWDTWGLLAREEAALIKPLGHAEVQPWVLLSPVTKGQWLTCLPTLQATALPARQDRLLLPCSPGSDTTPSRRAACVWSSCRLMLLRSCFLQVELTNARATASAPARLVLLPVGDTRNGDRTMQLQRALACQERLPPAPVIVLSLSLSLSSSEFTSGEKQAEVISIPNLTSRVLDRRRCQCFQILHEKSKNVHPGIAIASGHGEPSYNIPHWDKCPPHMPCSCLARASTRYW